MFQTTYLKPMSVEQVTETTRRPDDFGHSRPLSIDNNNHCYNGTALIILSGSQVEQVFRIYEVTFST